MLHCSEVGNKRIKQTFFYLVRTRFSYRILWRNFPKFAFMFILGQHVFFQIYIFLNFITNNTYTTVAETGNKLSSIMSEKIKPWRDLNKMRGLILLKTYQWHHMFKVPVKLLRKCIIWVNVVQGNGLKAEYIQWLFFLNK